MLEHSCLHVAGWTRSVTVDSAPAWIRPISDCAAHPLGFVRFKGVARPSWFSWLRSVRLEVYETEDASHLMSLVRSWRLLHIWDVYDAEECRIGSIYPPSVLDSTGQRRGYLDCAQPEQGAVVDTANHILASFRKQRANQLEVVFMPDPAANPFLRMLLLASFLILDSMPSEGN